MALRTTYKQHLHKSIQSVGMTVKYFRNTVDTDERFVLEYKRSGLRFELLLNENDHDSARFRYIRYNPMRQEIDGESWSIFSIHIVAVFQVWLKSEVANYITDEEAIDPWATEERSEMQFWTINTQHDTTGFSASEKNILVGRIDDLKETILSQFALSAVSCEEIKKELEYLSGRIDKLNRRDWWSVAKDIFVQIGMSIVAQMAIDYIPDTYTGLVKSLFSNLIRPPSALRD